MTSAPSRTGGPEELPPAVEAAATEAATTHGVEVLETRLVGGSSGRELVVVLDADEPVPSDTVEAVTRELSRLLDADELVSGRYTLQVGTPGLDRPLRTSRDFRRQRGHTVRATLTDAAGGGTVEGTVSDVADGFVHLDTSGQTTRVALADIGQGKVVLPW